MIARNLCVDGHTHPDSDSAFAGDGQFPPFAVFDIDVQENLAPYYLTRGQAELALSRMLCGRDGTETCVSPNCWGDSCAYPDCQRSCTEEQS